MSNNEKHIKTHQSSLTVTQRLWQPQKEPVPNRSLNFNLNWLKVYFVVIAINIATKSFLPVLSVTSCRKDEDLGTCRYFWRRLCFNYGPNTEIPINYLGELKKVDQISFQSFMKSHNWQQGSNHWKRNQPCVFSPPAFETLGVCWFAEEPWRQPLQLALERQRVSMSLWAS